MQSPPNTPYCISNTFKIDTVKGTVKTIYIANIFYEILGVDGFAPPQIQKPSISIRREVFAENFFCIFHSQIYLIWMVFHAFLFKIFP